MIHGKGAHIIVLGNEKGGSGKSTTAMHVSVALLTAGFTVGTLDLDSRQRSLTRYFENRRAWTERHNAPLKLPEHEVIARSTAETRKAGEAEERAHFESALARLATRNDFVVIDCPGTDTPLSRMGHAIADTLITPINDSFVDFDLLATVNPETFEIISPSLYSEMVWESRKRRAMLDRGSIDWIVMRNRVASLDAHNKRRVGHVMEKLSRRIGFRVGPGLGERVIYRELFPSGLTLLDLRETRPGGSLTMSHVAARQEVRAVLSCLRLPALREYRMAV